MENSYSINVFWEYQKEPSKYFFKNETKKNCKVVFEAKDSFEFGSKRYEAKVDTCNQDSIADGLDGVMEGSGIISNFWNFVKEDFDYERSILKRWMNISVELFMNHLQTLKFRCTESANVLIRCTGSEYPMYEKHRLWYYYHNQRLYYWKSSNTTYIYWNFKFKFVKNLLTRMQNLITLSKRPRSLTVQHSTSYLSITTSVDLLGNI